MRDGIINQKTFSDQVKEHIKKQIESGKLKPGDRIDEKELCKLLGLSRTPVREALIQLRNEDIIEILPRRSIRVKEHSLKDIKNIVEIISTLEAEAAEIAADLLTEEDISKMEEIYSQMTRALEKGDLFKYMQLNNYSHYLFVCKSDNEILVEIIDRLKKRLFGLPRILLNMPDWIEKLMNDHYNLIQLFKKKDKSEIKKLIKRHWDYNRDYI